MPAQRLTFVSWPISPRERRISEALISVREFWQCGRGWSEERVKPRGRLRRLVLLRSLSPVPATGESAAEIREGTLNFPFFQQQLM